MPLQKDTVSINIANSLDQKTDSKLIEPNRLASARNRRFPKVGTLAKRPGQQELSREILGAQANPLSIGEANSETTVSSFENQLLLDNNGALYSRRPEVEDAWQFVSHSSAMEVSSKNIFSVPQAVQNADSVIASGKTVVLYQSALPDFTAFYNVIENSTGIYLAKSIEIGPASYIKALSINDKAHLLYIDGTNLLRRTVDLSTGAVSAAVTLRTDANATSVMDAITMPSTVLGPIGVCAYRSGSQVKVFLLDENGAEITTPAGITVAESPLRGISLYHSPGLGVNSFTLAFQASSNIRCARFEIGVSSITTTFGPVTVNTTTSISDAIAQCLDPISGNLIIFYDSPNGALALTNNNERTQYVTETRLHFGEITAAGTPVGVERIYSIGLRLVGRPLIDTGRSTIYLPCLYDSYVASVFIMSDFNRGKAARSFYAQAKWFFGEAEGPFRNTDSSGRRSGPLFTVNQSGSGRYSFVGLTRQRVTGRTEITVAGNGLDRKPIFDVGLSIHEINLAAAAKSTLTLNGEYHASGGLLSHYDGSQLSESGFLVDPELLWASVGDTPLVVTFTDGTAGTPAQVKLQFAPGAAWDYLLTTPYVTFDTPSTDYYLWFEIDGVGVDPALPGRVGGKVAVSTLSSPGEIPNPVFSGSTVAIASQIRLTTTFEDDSLLIINSANGSVSAPAKTNLTFTVGGDRLSQGSYQYCAVWKWVDAKGLVHRSAPSAPVTVSSTTTNPNTVGAVNISVPPLTNRTLSECVVEVYRTTKDGTTFYLVYQTQAGSIFTYQNLKWPGSGTRVSFLDGVPDSKLTLGEILYTQGGVLPNYSIGAVRHVSTHQERVIVTTEDPNQLLFSKTLVDGEPITFAIENEIRVQTQDGPVTGHASLDDKLIIGKEESLYVVSGQFPNDLGTQGTLSEPQRIAADTGFLDHRSIVLYPDGLIYKSKKGFYSLTRALQSTYIGQAVEDFNSFTVSQGVLDTLNNEIRFYFEDTDSLIVYDYLQNKWAVWDNSRAQSACVHLNEIHRAESSGKVHKSTEGIFKDVTIVDGDEVTTFYGSDFEMPWLKLKGLQDFQRIWFAALLGEYKSKHEIQAQFFYDYNITPTDTYTADSEEIKAGVYQWEIKPRIQKCQAIKIKFTETPDADAVGQTGQSADFTDVSFVVGLKAGLNKFAKAKRD